MSLYDRMKRDNKTILNNNFIVTLILTNASGDTQTGLGRFTNPGMVYSPEGLPGAGTKLSIAFHIDDFVDITATENENYEGWQAEFLNIQGETKKGLFLNPMIDKTYGYVVTTITSNKVVS